MFLVQPDHVYGLVAAPESSDDLILGTEEALTVQGFAWNTKIEAYTRPAENSPEDVYETAAMLRDLGHHVISVNMAPDQPPPGASAPGRGAP